MTTEEPVVVVEVAAPAIEATATVVVEKEPAMEAGKARSQKCEKRSMKRKTTITSLHPPYFDMIKDAISSLKEKIGSSQYAIAKFIKEKQKNLPRIFKKVLLIQLKRPVTKGKLVKVKASYKLPTTSAQMKKKSPTKPNASARPKSPVKKALVKKPSTKPKSASKANVVANPKAIAKLVAKATPKTPTKPAKVARTSTQGKKPTPARKSFKVTKKSTLRKVSSVIAKTSAKMVEPKSVKTKSATLKKPTARKIEKRM